VSPAPRWRASPNFDERAEPVDMLILHYTGMQTAAAALDRLCDPDSRVSAHYVIEEDGAVWQLVEEERRAWHAGVSRWRGAPLVNGRSIGIELVNPGHEFGYRPFPAAQIDALIPLCRGILARHAIPPRHVLGHADVAPARKEDPGELFPWQTLAAGGIGLWPTPAAEADHGWPAVARDLAFVGYDVGSGEPDDPALRLALVAFQRHWRQRLWDGRPDRESAAQLAGLCALIG
jgi:N-acetylmuramoyl-L-alanine amidase